MRVFSSTGAVVDLGDLTPDGRQKTLEEFDKRGSLWEPTLTWIRVISLVRADYLIMPPGTIHALIIVTKCLFLARCVGIGESLWLILSRFGRSLENI